MAGLQHTNSEVRRYGMAASKTLRNGVAAIIVALAGAALALMWWTGQRAMALQVPITLSLAVDDTVWVSSHGALHELDAEGQRLNRLPMESLGLPRPLLHLHAVRRDDLLVSAGEPVRVYRCAPSQRACRLIDRGYIERFGKFKNAVWLGANADGSRVVASDNAAHRVAVFDGDSGALLAAAGGGIGRFHYPGQPVWVGEKSIWLAGADHRRIERFEYDGNAIGEPVQTIGLTKGDVAIDGRTWPMALAPLGEGQWWALVKVHDLRAGGLVRWNEQGRFTASARLPEGADPTAVTRLGGQLVVADLEGPALHRLTLAGTDARPFGSDEFQAELQAHGGEVAQWYRWQEWAQWALIGAPILGVILLLLLGERVELTLTAPHLRPQHAAPTWHVGSTAAGPVDIGLSDDTQRLQRRMAWVQLLTLPALVVLIYFIFAPALEPGQIAILALAGTMAAVAAVWQLRQGDRRRLRVHGESVSLMVGERVVVRANLADCRTDGRTLLIGQRRVLLMQGKLHIFEVDALQRDLLSRLGPQQWHTPTSLELKQLRDAWRRHPWRTGLVWLGVIVIVVLWVWLKLRTR